MPLELAQVVAGFPVAASLAIAGGISALREGRRRASLNEAVHELRRPLQVLSFSLSADAVAPRSLESSLRLAAVAVDRLEREINGEAALTDLKLISVKELAEAATERWQPHTVLMNRTLDLQWRADDPLIRGSEIELEQALDNLISNAFEHGRGKVTLEVRETDEWLRFAIRDSGTLTSPLWRRNSRWEWARIRGRSRHGHGLRVVRRVASRHGGRFCLWGTDHGTEARLELPLDGAIR